MFKKMLNDLTHFAALVLIACALFTVLVLCGTKSQAAPKSKVNAPAVSVQDTSSAVPLDVILAIHSNNKGK